MTTIEEPQRSLDHLHNPDVWTNWPIQPVKKGTFPDALLGIIIEEHRACVYHVNMWAVRGKLNDALKDVPTTVYEDHEAMVNDGWRVD